MNAKAKSNRGGARKPGPGKKMGRPPKPKVATSTATKGIATKVLDEIDEVLYWLFLLHHDEMKDATKRAALDKQDRIQIAVNLQRLTDRRDGTAPQRIDTAFNPETPLRVIIDHIGRPKDQAAAQAKLARGPVE